MSKQPVRKPLSIALGAAVVALGTAGIANAAETTGNVFSMQDLGSGYLLAGAHGTDKDKKKDKEGEGHCGHDKGEKGDKGGEGKCGEGKCGST